MKDAGLRIRVDRGLREAFLAVCKAQDRPAAQVLREFMRGYVKEHAADVGEPNAPPESAVRLEKGMKRAG